jgi:hypothetical protein
VSLVPDELAHLANRSFLAANQSLKRVFHLDHKAPELKNNVKETKCVFDGGFNTDHEYWKSQNTLQTCLAPQLYDVIISTYDHVEAKWHSLDFIEALITQQFYRTRLFGAFPRLASQFDVCIIVKRCVLNCNKFQR